VIEIIQGAINILSQYDNRSVDIDDIILNTIGAAFGFLIFKLIKPIVHKLFPNLVCYNLTDKV
jgi:glycopeptide antibiotics resistance protein